MNIVNSESRCLITTGTARKRRLADVHLIAAPNVMAELRGNGLRLRISKLNCCRLSFSDQIVSALSSNAPARHEPQRPLSVCFLLSVQPTELRFADGLVACLLEER